MSNQFGETSSPRVWDYRRDIANIIVTPEIRARFLRMEPGEIGPRHWHDLGFEVFLILEGTAEFLIGEERITVRPGQLCAASPYEIHEVRVVGDEPVTMYLSVTPHLEPTHTAPGDDGGRPLVASWAPAGLANWQPGTAEAPDLARAYEQLLETAIDRLTEHRDDFRRAMQSPGGVEALAAWESLRAAMQAVSVLENGWNRLQYRLRSSSPD